METEADIHTGSEGATTDVAPAPDAHAADLERLSKDLEAARAEASENLRKYQLALADLDNFRKLTEKRTIDRLALGKKSTITKFLPVLDNLQRALAFEQDSQGLRGGLNATMRGFESVLAGENVTTLVLVGAPFDPRTAEAITTRDSSDHDDDVVIEEVERGYKLGDDILRPAKVIVARRVPAAG